jgi:predicted MFS family arabinose efflux permease
MVATPVGTVGGTPDAAAAPRGQAYRIYVVLCAGFLASQFYRVSNAVIAPELMRGLEISAEAMGIITGVYFLAFAVAQLPIGVLLDRFGPRQTMAGLFLLAVAGSVTFATASGFAGLVLGRGLMGIGCAAGLMGSLVAIARWFPPARFAFLSSLLFTLGGAGLLLATTPLAVVSAAVGWRGAFWLMAAVTAALAMLLYVVVRDAPGGHPAHVGRRESAAEMWHGLRAVMGNRELRYVCAIQFVNYGTVLAVAGLWAGPYLNDVHGLDGVSRGNVLLLLNVAMLAGVMGFSVVERWLGSRKWSIGSGGIASMILLLVLASVPDPGLWPAVVLLVLFGLASAYVMLIHAQARAVLPPDLVGRGLTLQNLAVFVGVFVMQALSGFIVGAFGSPGGTAPEAAYRAVFGVLAVVTGAALLIYLRCEEPLQR